MKLNFDHLKAYRSSEGYWSTTDCLKVAEDIIKTTSAKSMLEIGFNIGYSASCWLESGVTDLFIIDIGVHSDTIPALESTKKHYHNRTVDWIISDSKHVDPSLLPNVDISFIDGEHSYEAVLSDTALSISKGVSWLVYDDVIYNHENGIYAALQKLEEDNKISIEKVYPMTWTEQGYVVLAKPVQ
jgi:predicted O-methyltransferase YrrM